MSSSKSNRKNREAKLLGEVKRVRGEIKNLDTKLSEKLESLTNEIKNLDEKLLGETKRVGDEIRTGNTLSMFRDAGIIILTIGGILIALSFSLLQISLEPQIQNLVLKSRWSGLLFIVTGGFFICASFLKSPSRDLLRVPFKKERLIEYLFLGFVIFGIIFGIISFLILL